VSARIVSADELWKESESRSEEGAYSTASRLCQDFFRRFPEDPRSSEAQFNAGFLLQLERPTTKESRDATLTQAAELLSQFVEKNPTDLKRARAVSVLGEIYCSLGRYTEATELLRDPKRQLEDPDAALPILRTLALANLGIGNYDGAESAYLQAAVLPKNYTCDQDYRALGDMFRQRADITPTDEEKKKLLEMSLKYWKMAVEMSGMDPSDRKQVQQQIDRTEIETGGVPAEGKDPADTEAAPSEEAAPKAGAVDIEPAPDAEQRQLAEEGEPATGEHTP
jgi:TolA-binding protein